MSYQIFSLRVEWKCVFFGSFSYFITERVILPQPKGKRWRKEPGVGKKWKGESICWMRIICISNPFYMSFPIFILTQWCISFHQLPTSLTLLYPILTNVKSHHSGKCPSYFMLMWFTWLCLTLCDPMDCSSPSSSVYGIFQARILESVASPFSTGSSQPLAGRFFPFWATRES